MLDELAVDPDFLHIRDEIELYGKLRFGEQFQQPLPPADLPAARHALQGGRGAMMEREQQLRQTSFNFEATFAPNPRW